MPLLFKNEFEIINSFNELHPKNISFKLFADFY